MQIFPGGPGLWEVLIPTLAGIIGALAGGIPSYFLAQRASKEVLERDRQSRLDKEQGAAHRAFVKLCILSNSLADFHNQVEEMIARAERDGHTDMLLHERISSFAGVERELTPDFEAEELALFVSAKQTEYVDDLILLPRRHRAAIESLSTFGLLKTEFHYRVAEKGSTTRDQTGVSRTIARMTTGEANRVRLQSEELELFATAMRKQLREFAEFGESVANRYGDIVRAYFDDASMVGIGRKEPVGGEPPESTQA
ncbi:hypothetical protein ACFQ1E_20310 [Sphingomonas canadensis]|uniref:Uncharacterized protein n=1 Tax=Sphingomonas canadensis TaxID=1219257 RepID=A0ABW3HB25_9SPHN|nr:hypothetical protein [Sphingomonas canadensis]MCW3838398.1 hypothetical protein [Sphingomonas canadensis]